MVMLDGIPLNTTYYFLQLNSINTTFKTSDITNYILIPKSRLWSAMNL